MLHIFATLFLSTLVATATPAAAPDPTTTLMYSPRIVAHATALTRALAQRIHFNEGQYLKVKALHLQMLAERCLLESGLAGATPAERDTWLATAQARYEAELTTLLQPEQRVAYQQLRSNLTAHRLN